MSAPTSIAHYKITAKLGEGGMGAVYRATDTRLNRQVAIKVLPEAVTTDPERMARFEREAQVLASLNHPNIATIYGVEEGAIVMELVEGEDLKGPIPIGTAIQYARQIAAGLEAAHEKNVVHRDLKPANIKVTGDGVVKLLDFGLAAVPGRSQTTPADGDRANSPTVTIGTTQAGMIMGTASYMSPEQAAGKPVDKRADIWSFGVVLYEMLTGRQLFHGETLSHTLADVLRAPINLDGLPTETPAALRDLLRRCLNRDVKSRLRDIGDARIVLEEAPEAATPAASPSWPRSASLLAVLAAVCGVALAMLAFVHFRERPAVPEPMRFQIPTPPGKGLMGSVRTVVSVSPDGRHIAYTGLDATNQTVIWVRSLDKLDAHPLPHTAGVATQAGLFWSPDSRQIAFPAGGGWQRIELSGGPVQTVCELPGGLRGGSWAPDGTILFGASTGALMRAPASGGSPAVVFSPSAGDSRQFLRPSFLPDGRHFVYLAGTLPSGPVGIYLGSLDSKGEPAGAKPLVNIHYPNAAIFAPSPDPDLGYLLFEQDGSLEALPLDLRHLKPAGPAVAIAEGAFAGASSYSASTTGVLAYTTPASSIVSNSLLLWFDRQGKQTGQVGRPAPYSNVRLSPDGKLLVVDYLLNSVFEHLWSGDPARGIFSRVNPGDAQDYSGVLSPDGRVAFTYTSGGAAGAIYVRSASGAGNAEPLVESPFIKHPNDWSLDGRYLIYDEHGGQQQDLWIVPLSGDRKPIPFLATPADETDASFSPDTKWIAYSSDESGRREVYVQGFVPDHVPAAGIGKWPISSAGGAKPRWRRDGKELYYLASDGKLMAVPVKSTATTFEPGVGVPLFEVHARGYMPFDVAADGRFLINSEMQNSTPPSSPITVVANWTTGLKK